MDLARRLTAYGYRTTPQTGSPSQHHITVPAHDPVKIGTRSSMLTDVAAPARVNIEVVKQTLFG